MNEKQAEIILKISVDTAELDKAMEKVKELLATLEKCGQVTLKED